MNLLAVVLMTCLLMTATSSTCLNKNPLLAELQKGGVVIFDHPQKTLNSSICGGLWQAEGTCCDQPSLIQWSEKDKNTLEKLVDSVMKGIADLNAIISSKAKSLSNSKIDVDFITRFQNSSLSTALQNATFKCWSYMRNVRSASLCFVCSGHSKQYFINDKAAVTPNQCGGVIQACNSYFIEAFRLLTGFGSLVNNILKIFPSLLSTSPALVNWAKNLETTLKKFDVLNVLESMNEMKFNEPMKQKMEIAICNRYFNIVKSPWIQVTDRLLKTLTTLVPLTLSPAADIANLIKPLGNWKLGLPTRKLLIEAADVGFNPLIEADTQVLLQSSDVDSLKKDEQPTLLKSGHSSSDIATSHSTKPMNLSLVFP